jgi:hypothetical protein
MSGIWFFIIAVHLGFIAFGGAIWYFYKKYKDIM